MGWFPGYLKIHFKHNYKIFAFTKIVSKWFFWRRKRTNQSVEPLLHFIANKAILELNKVNHRVVSNFTDIAQGNKCPSCGQEIDQTMDFCGNCGAKLK